MQFDEAKVREVLHAEWSWILPKIAAVMAVSSMGNVMLRDEDQNYWRICPEELSVEIFARTSDELKAAFANPDYKADWQMSSLVSECVREFGEPEIGECFGLVVPAVLGGEYALTNIRIRNLYDYLRYTGDLANQTKDLKEGESVAFNFIDSRKI